MLSIGKLTPGRASYYAEQLPGGRDEYYTGGEREGHAVWLGSAAERIGLGGEVGPDGFRRLLEAAHPQTGDPLGVPRTTARRLAGYDLCFSAPKSVSVAWALAPPEISDLIAGAHDRAVHQTIEVFETEVGRARRGKHAATLIQTEGVIAAGFGHRTSRSGDPQLHTHVVIPNLTVDSNGRWSALAGDRIYRYAKTLGYLYQAALRAELTTTLGIAFGPVSKGAAEIAGVDPSLRELFSTRRGEIVAAMRQAGARSRSAAEVAALTTRTTKRPDLDLEDLRHSWRRRAEALGVDLEPIRELRLSRGHQVDRTAELAPRLLSAEGLTANSSTFDRRDLLQAIASAHSEGLAPGQAVEAAERILQHPNVVPLQSDRPAGPRYSTTELIGIETDLVDRAARRHDHLATVPEELLAEVFAARPSLTAEQRAMVASLTSSGAGVEVVVGRAGAGKTFALDAAREAWQRAGCQVVGAALAARAAAELQAGTGIPATTLDRLLADLDRPGPLSPLRGSTVVVVDEAAMVGTRKLARLARHAERAKAKLVLIGDHRQLPEIAAGGAFSGLRNRVPTTELTGNSRQVQQWERDALAELRSGSVPEAVAAYRREGRVALALTADAARQQMVDDWWRAWRSGNRVAMYALRRTDVEDLNRAARARLDAAGLLGDKRMEAAGREFAEGDHVICTRNDRRLGVTNGTRSTVETVDHDTGDVLLSNGKRLPADYVQDGHLSHAYATTIHKAQGATVDTAFLLGSDTLYREAGYVGLSRARQSTQLYIVSPDPQDRLEPDPLIETIRRLGESKAQTLASDQLEPSHPSPGTTRSQLDDERAVLLADPPGWLIQSLGPPPVTGTERNRWAERAQRLAAYRDIYQITDPANPLGPRPDNPTQLRAWELSRLALVEHQRSLDLEQGLQR